MFPQWEGKLFVGALCQTPIRREMLDDPGEAAAHEQELLRDLGQRIRDVRTGPDRHLWFATDASSNDGLYQIEPVE